MSERFTATHLALNENRMMSAVCKGKNGPSGGVRGPLCTVLAIDNCERAARERNTETRVSRMDEATIHLSTFRLRRCAGRFVVLCADFFLFPATRSSDRPAGSHRVTWPRSFAYFFVFVFFWPILIFCVAIKRFFF